MFENPPESPAARLQRLAVLVLVSALWSGCASNAERGAADYSDTPLPYSVGVFFDPAISSLPPAAPASASGRTARFLKSGREVAEAVARALTEDYPVVSRARVLDVESQDEVREAARQFDFLMGVGLRAPSRYDEVSRPLGLATGQVFLWLFGGVPSWFVPGLSYRTDTRLTVDVADVNLLLMSTRSEAAGTSPPKASAKISHEVVSETNALSLWDRADILDEPGSYALSIIVPPMFILPDDHELESQALTECVLDDLTEQLAESLKDRLVSLELAKPLRVVFRSPAPGAGLGGPRLKLVLDVISRNGVPIRRIDVRRFSNGGPTYRWVPERDELREWNRALASGSGRVSVELADGLPLVPGRNVIQVRLLRADGERLTRTAVYDYHEGK